MAGPVSSTRTKSACRPTPTLTAAAQLNSSNFQNYRLFVERGGITYVGYRDKQMVSNQQRLNGTAADALLAALGLN